MGVNGLVLVFTPAAALAVNATYTATVDNVVDIAGNAALGQPFVTTFQTLDTLGPVISELRLADGKSPVAGGQVQIEAVLTTNEAGASVRFSQDLNPAGIAGAEPYRVTVTLPTNGTTTFRAIATDVYRNDGPLAELTVAVVSNQPPTVQLARTNPVSGTVSNYQSFALVVGGADDLDVTNLNLTLSGALTFTTNLPGGQEQVLQFTVPADAAGGSEILVRAEAVDSLAAVSEEASLVLTVVDTVAPILSFVSPAANSTVNPQQVLDVAVGSFDNSANYQLELSLSGGLNETQRVSVASAGLAVTNLFTFSLTNAATVGTNLIATLRAIDGNSNAAILGRTFFLPDTYRPVVVLANPPEGAVRQSLWLGTIEFLFDGELMASTVNSNTVLFTNNAGLEIPYTVGLGSNGKTLQVQPTVLPLTPGVIYTNRFLAELSDVASNQLAGEMAFTFTTAAIQNISPSNGTPVVPGQLLRPAVAYETGLGASSFRFVLQGHATNEVAVSTLSSNALGAVRLGTNAAEARLSISAGKASFPSYLFPEITLTVRPRSGDDDSDGWDNGFEADRGMDPFASNSDGEDFDGDGLSNGQERSLGTDPGTVDSDGDTLSDGHEVNVLGTNPLNADTDGDGVNDNIDTEPIANQARPPLVDAIAPFEIVEGSMTNVLVSGRDPDFNLRTLRVNALSGGTNWAVLRWTNSGNASYTVTSNVFSLTGTLQLLNQVASTAQLELVAVDADTLTATQVVEVVVLADMDRDGTPNRSDDDIDGDGLSNQQESDLGTDPLNRDTDADQIVDGADPLPFVRNVKPVAGTLHNGHALAFDGGDFVRVGDAPALRLLTNFTVECWFKAGRVQDGTLFGKGLGGSWDNSYVAWFSSDGVLSCYTGAGQQINAAGVVPGKWYHFAMVKSNASVQMFLNGGRVAETTNAAVAVPYDGRPLLLGADDNDNNGVPDGNFTGVIDEFRLWPAALSPEQFYRANFRTNLPSDAIAGYWTLDEGQGTNALDRTTNGNLGTLGVGASQPAWTNGMDAFSLLTITGSVPSLVFNVGGADPEGQPITALIKTLPAGGRLYETADGVTLGARITNAPHAIASSNFQVVYVPPRGISTNLEFIFQTSDGYLFSGDGLVRLTIVADPAADTDGDDLTDVYEAANRLDPETHDSSADADGDGLSNLNEFLSNADPQRPDTDNDGLTDGQEFASNTNPLLRDTDGDGIPDGSDPQPTIVTGGLPADPVEAITITEGESTNITVRFTSDTADIVLVDYVPTNLPPAFVSLPVIQFTNWTTNGEAIAQLSLNPLHDAAGTYTIAIRAAAANGVSGVMHLNVTVLDNPALGETRWKEAVTGNWNDASRWTAGVPTSNTVAVIDVPGSYTVNLNADFAGRGLVLNEGSATLVLHQNQTFNVPVENRRGNIHFSTGNHLTVTINRSFYNGGNFRLTANYYTSWLAGSGWIENAGLMHLAVGVGGYGGSEAGARLPINIPVSGRLVVNANGFLNLAGGAFLRVAGKVEVQSGGRLRLENAAPARDLTLLAGGEILGDGILQLEGSNRLVPIGDAIAVVKLRLYESSSVAGPGRLFLYGDQILVGGTYASRLRIASGARVELRHVTIRGETEVEPGALLYVAPSGDHYNINLENVLTNRGTLRLVGNWYRSLFYGAGRIDNAGLIDMTVGLGGYSGTECLLRVPLHVTPTGRLRVNQSGYLNIQNGGGQLTVAGVLEIQPGARLRLEAASAWRDALFLPGSQFVGTGTLQLENNNQMMVAGELQPGPHLALNDNSKVVGEGQLNLVGNRLLSGNYQLRLKFLSNCVAELRHCTFGSNVVIEANALVYFAPTGDHYNLRMDAPLTNHGTLRLVGNWYRSLIYGAGEIENRGLIEIMVVGGNYSSTEALINLPVHVAPSGRLRLNESAYLNFQNGRGSLTVAGVVEVQSGARLRFEASSAWRAVTFLPGSQLVGAGTVRLDNNNQLLAGGDLAPGPHLELWDNSLVTGEGPLVLSGNRLLSGNYQIPLQFVTNCVAELRYCTFGSNVVIEAGALVYFRPTDDHYNLRMDAPLTNHGTLRLVGNWYRSLIYGAGEIENRGLIEIMVVGGNYSSTEALINLPVHVAPSGRLRLNESAYLNFQNGRGLLTVAGVVEVQSGARLRFEASSAWRAVTFLPGSQLTGAGTVQLHNNNQLLVISDLAPGPHLGLVDNAQVTGPGCLLLSGNRYLGGNYQIRLQLLTNCAAELYSATFGSNVVIDPGAFLYFRPTAENYNLTLDGTLTNNGHFRLVGNWQRSSVTGAGYLENNGLIDMSVGVGGYGSAEALINVPLHVNAAGHFRLNTNGYVNFQNGRGLLTVTGTLEIQPGARLRFEPSSGVRDTTFLPGAQLPGPGTLQLENNNRLVVLGDLAPVGHIALRDNSQVAGPGLVLFTGNAVLGGNYQARLQFLTNCVADLRHTTFGSNVVIDLGALVYLQPSGDHYTLNIHGTLTNHGTFRMVANWYGSTVQGSGQIENFGLIDLAVGVGGYGQREAVLRLPVHVNNNSRFLINTNGYLYVGGGGGLTVAGTLEVQTGGRLRFNDGSSVHLTLESGGTVAGNGTVQVESSCVVNVPGNATLAGGMVSLADSSTLAGTGTLTIRSNATLRMDHPVSFPGSITTEGTLTYVSGTSQILGTFTLAPGGTLNNPAVLQVGAYVPGGTVVGNAPVVIGGTGARMKFTGISFPTDSPKGTLSSSVAQKLVQLAWEGPTQQWCVIEISRDLVNWQPAPVTITEVSSGHYQAQLPLELGQFFRLRVTL